MAIEWFHGIDRLDLGRSVPTLTTDPSLEGFLVRLSPSGGTSVGRVNSRFGAKPSTVSNLNKHINAKKGVGEQSTK